MPISSEQVKNKTQTVWHILSQLQLNINKVTSSCKYIARGNNFFFQLSVIKKIKSNQSVHYFIIFSVIIMNHLENIQKNAHRTKNHLLKCQFWQLTSFIKLTELIIFVVIHLSLSTWGNSCQSPCVVVLYLLNP